MCTCIARHIFLSEQSLKRQETGRETHMVYCKSTRAMNDDVYNELNPKYVQSREKYKKREIDKEKHSLFCICANNDIKCIAW
jgi:hypothetical protein